MRKDGWTSFSSFFLKLGWILLAFHTPAKLPAEHSGKFQLSGKIQKGRGCHRSWTWSQVGPEVSYIFPKDTGDDSFEMFE